MLAHPASFPEQIGDFNIHITNTPMWSFPNMRGSASMEKSNLHFALCLAIALRGSQARVTYYCAGECDVAAYAPSVPLNVISLLPVGIREQRNWTEKTARHVEDQYYSRFYEHAIKAGANVIIVGGDAQSFREVASLSLLLPNMRFFCHVHGIQSSVPMHREAYMSGNPYMHYIAMSRAQIAADPAIHYAGFVYNSLHPSEFSLQKVPSAYAYSMDGRTRTIPPNYLLFVGRLNRQKGVHLAIAAATSAHIPLLIAGPIAEQEWDPHYFADEIAPFIDDHQVIYLGELNAHELDKVYRGAAALLFPIQWEEPFGFVTIEAMARGVPVIAPPIGAMKEIIQPDINGYWAHSLDHMLTAIRQISLLDRSEVAASVADKFTWVRSGKKYVSLIVRSFQKKPD